MKLRVLLAVAVVVGLAGWAAAAYTWLRDESQSDRAQIWAHSVASEGLLAGKVIWLRHEKGGLWRTEVRYASSPDERVRYLMNVAERSIDDAIAPVPCPDG